MRTIQIAILVHPHCVGSSATAPADVFSIANAIVRRRPAAEQVRFTSTWVSAPGGTVTLRNGVSFATNRIADTQWDALMVPGIEVDSTRELAAALEQLAAERDALRTHAGRALLAANCNSSYLLAEAGLLAGRRCTTSWWLGNHFSQRYPDVGLQSDQILVQDGSILTSGGVTAYLDLSLWLVGHFGGEALRQITAKVLVTDSNRLSQSPYVAAALAQGGGHAVVEQARRWLNQHLDDEWSMENLAKACNTSARTLLRRFRDAVGLSPVQYAQQLRVERAKGLLESTRLSLEAITARCGYEDVSTFSKVFKRWTDVTPREYRRRFGLRA